MSTHYLWISAMVIALVVFFYYYSALGTSEAQISGN
jgi:hypothetical protein